MTSGTTKSGIRGKSYHPTLAVYDRSMTKNFKHRFMQGRDRIRMGILFPTEEAMPNSSLAHYLGLALRNFGTKGSHYLINETGLDTGRLFYELTRGADRRASCPLGGQLQLCAPDRRFAAAGPELCIARGQQHPGHGRVQGAVTRTAANGCYNQLSATLGVPRHRCINMYGMTELSTQFYDRGNETCPSIKSGPHWIRTR